MPMSAADNSEEGGMGGTSSGAFFTERPREKGIVARPIDAVRHELAKN